MTTTKTNRHTTILKAVHAPKERLPKQRVGPPGTDAGQTDNAQRIKLHRVDGKIETIEVTCDCGQTLVIRCDYE